MSSPKREQNLFNYNKCHISFSRLQLQHCVLSCCRWWRPTWWPSIVTGSWLMRWVSWKWFMDPLVGVSSFHLTLSIILETQVRKTLLTDLSLWRRVQSLKVFRLYLCCCFTPKWTKPDDQGHFVSVSNICCAPRGRGRDTIKISCFHPR